MKFQSPTSPRATVASPPAARISSATASTLSLMSLRMTLAPPAASASASTRPSP